jgi:phospholipid/cholesterol/gamma-HCH transport system permease protein
VDPRSRTVVNATGHATHCVGSTVGPSGVGAQRKSDPRDGRMPNGRVVGIAAATIGKPARGLGEFFALSLEIMVQLVRPPFAWREFLLQSWFVARVSIVPAILLAIALNAFIVFLLNVLLLEIGAADIAGAGAGLAAVTQACPAVTVLVVSGAGATAMCADLGARTIREELDAMRVMGKDPVRVLLVPRLAALTVNAFLLLALTIVLGIVADYVFAVYFQHVTPGAFAGSLTLVTGLRQTLIGIVKSIVFGATAGFIACYKGVSVGGGPQSVGNAVNETVVFSFIALFAINIVFTAIEGKMVL